MKENNYSISETRPVKTIINYYSSLAFALIASAEENVEFRKKFTYLLRNNNVNNLKSAPNTILDRKVKLLSALDTDTALKKSIWLMDRILPANNGKKTEALEILAGWVKDQPYESPRQLVVGALAVAIPGITLGKFPSKKRMSVLIAKHIVDSKKIAQLSVEAASGILAQQFKKNPNLDQLEPDVADWFYGERTIKLFSADHEKFTQVMNDLKELSIFHEVLKDDNGIVALAISPAINNYFGEYYWDLEEK